MSKWIAVVVVLALGACKKHGAESPASAARSYTLYTSVDPKVPPAGIAVTVEVPAGWAEELDASGSPAYKLHGSESVLPEVSIVAIYAKGATPVERIQHAMKLQFGDGPLPAGTSLSDGRVWVVDSSLPQRIHARMFIPAGAESVVMCVVLTTAEHEDVLPGATTFCNSVHVK